MLQLIRNIRYRRQLAEIAYHQRRCEEFRLMAESAVQTGRYERGSKYAAQMSACAAHHRYMIEQLKAQIYGGAE
mgnify:CR=1 FL=1